MHIGTVLMNLGSYVAQPATDTVMMTTREYGAVPNNDKEVCWSGPPVDGSVACKQLRNCATLLLVVL